MMRSSGYNRFGVLMGTSWPASCPRSHRLQGDFSPMITLILLQRAFCATAWEQWLDSNLFVTLPPRLLSCGATPQPSYGTAQRLECESPCPLAHPTASLPAARPGGAGHCGRTGALSRPPQQGDPRAAELLHQEPEPHGVCHAHRHEASYRERSDCKYRAACGQSAL